MLKRRKRPRRALRFSFAVTFSVLTLILVAVYANAYLNPVPVKHLPAQTPEYQAEWAKYVPASVLQFSFQNFTYVKQLNSSLPFFNTILQISNPAASLTTEDVVYFVSMQFGIPNASVDIAFLKPSSYSSFAAKFADLTSFGHPVGNNSLYQVLDTATGKPTLGVLALIPGDRAVGFAPGISEAEDGVTRALRVPDQVNASILGLPDVRQMLYIVGGASNHIALGLYSFNTEISTSQKTLTAIDQRGTRINVSRVIAFPDSSTAYDQFSTVRQTYLGATNIIVFDSYVRASQLDHISKLGGDYRLVQ